MENQLNYEVYGEGHPIYFIHGNTLSLISMKAVYEDLFVRYNGLKGYKRIYIDLPGMGASTADYELDNSDKIVEKIISLIQYLTPKQNITLVGHSYGGYLCLGIQHLLGACVQQLYLTCPVVKAVYEDRLLPDHRHIIIDEIEEKNELYKEFLMSTVKISKASWALYQTIIHPGVRVYDRAYNEFLMRDNRKYYRLSFEPAIQPENVRSMVILGRNDDVVGYQDQWELFKDDNLADVYVLSEAGHNMMLDELEFIQQQFIRFFNLEDNDVRKGNDDMGSI